jgi:hypothetical protein
MLFAGKWVELEDIMLSETSQTQKDKYLISLSQVFSLMCGKLKQEPERNCYITGPEE